MTVTVGVLALLEAKPEKGAELEALLVQARQLALAEQQTISWYAFQADEVTFGIFDTLERRGAPTHLGGRSRDVIRSPPSCSPRSRHPRSTCSPSSERRRLN